MTSLQDLKLGRKGSLYRVGDKLGEGAFGIVHKVKHLETGDDSEWAVKLTPHPKKKTKKGTSQEEVNAAMLFRERTLYYTGLIGLQGTVVPRLPTSSKIKLEAFGQDAEAGWDFLIMEQMECELFDVLSSFATSSSTSIAVGQLAQRLLTICESVHELSLLITDVKKDNFMIARGNGMLANRIRLVDLGLLRNFRDGCGMHITNGGVKGLNGTPLYASLNAHELQTISRRDDIESLLYLIGEMVIYLNALVQGKLGEYEVNGSVLPWIIGRSNDQTFELKKRSVSDIKSEYYKRMPVAAAATLKECWDEVRSYKFKATPAYTWLKEKLSSLTVPAIAKKKVSNKRKCSTQRVASKVSKPENGTVRRTRSSKSVPNIESDDSDDPMEIDEIFHDHEPANLENVVPACNNTSVSNGKPGRQYFAAKLEVIEGPMKGVEWIIQEGGDEKYCIGSKPSKKGFKPFALQDDSVDPSHACIELKLSSKSLLLHVTDLKSKGGTFLNGVKVKTDNGMFHGYKLSLGKTTLRVSRISPSTA